jgi:histone deacetylase 1/2
VEICDNRSNFFFFFSSKIVDNLRGMPFAPSAPLQEVPRDFNLDDYNDGEDSEAEEADIRQTRKFVL